MAITSSKGANQVAKNVANIGFIASEISRIRDIGEQQQEPFPNTEWHREQNGTGNGLVNGIGEGEHVQ